MVPNLAEYMLTAPVRARASALVLATHALAWMLAEIGIAIAARITMTAPTLIGSMSVDPRCPPGLIRAYTIRASLTNPFVDPDRSIRVRLYISAPKFAKFHESRGRQGQRAGPGRGGGRERGRLKLRAV